MVGAVSRPAPVAVVLPPCHLIRPRAPERHVEIDPRVDGPPLLVRQLHALVSGLENLHERTRIGVVFHRVHEAVVRFGPRTPHPRDQIEVALREGPHAAGALAVRNHGSVYAGGRPILNPQRPYVGEIRLVAAREQGVFEGGKAQDAAFVGLAGRDGRIGVLIVAADAPTLQDRLHFT